MPRGHLQRPDRRSGFMPFADRLLADPGPADPASSGFADHPSDISRISYNPIRPM